MALVGKTKLQILSGTKTSSKSTASTGGVTGRAPTRWDIITFVVGAITLASIGVLVATTISYWSFAQNVFMGYQDELNMLRNDRIIKLEGRIYQLENAADSTASAN